MTDGEQDEGADGGEGGEHDGNINDNEDATADAADASSSTCPWVAYDDDEGREYFYNQSTGETQWDRPDDMPAPPSSSAGEGGEGDAAAAAAAGDADGGHVDADGDGSGEVGKDEQPPTEETKGEGEGHVAADDDDDDVAESPSKAGEVKDDVEEEGGKGRQDDDEATADAAAAGDAATAGEDTPAEGKAGESPWAAYTDDEGREYFYNQQTGETQWERPEDMPAPPSSAKEGEEEGGRDVTGEGDAAAEPAAAEPAAAEDAEMKEPEQEEKEEEDAVSKALSALKETDAILEPDCLSHLSELVTGLGGSVGGPKAIKNLVAGYHGQTAICGLMGAWLTDLLASTDGNGGGGGGGGPNKSLSSTSAMGVLPSTAAAAAGMRDPRDAAADATRTIAENVVKGMATERFTKTGGDNILRLSKSEAVFLEDIFDSDRFRHLLIDLSAKHKDSALLMYCLQSISKRGHHREIAKRINQSDYFGVFSAMLSSELSIIGKMAVGANSDDTSVPNNGADASSDIGKDLQRTCTSTSYTFLYAMEALEDLVRRAESKKGGGEILRRAIRKWEKLKEDLEEAMLSQTTGSSPLAKKRRIDVTLTSSELQQRQRRKIEPGKGAVTSANDSSSDGPKSPDPLRSTVASDVLSLVRKTAVGMPIDALLAERLAKASSVGSTPANGINQDVGALLVAHPTSIIALLGNLFRSGSSSRVQANEANKKYARLIARSVLASRRLAFATNGDVSEANAEQQDEEEEGIIKDLLCGSDLCEQVSNMVSFTVLDDESAGESASVGRRLSALTIKSAPVAQGVLLWATELASGGEFLASAAYPTVAPGVLGLARIIATHHPFTRNAVLDLTYVFLSHSNPDLSLQKTQALKEQSLRLLMWLSTQGMALSVFSTISNKLNKGSAGIGSSLVRYFLGGCLDIIRPPFSVPFVRSMGAMLLTKPSIDALRSTYFPTEKKNALKQLIKGFKAELAHDSCSGFVTQDDRNLVSALFALYGGTQ